MMSPTVHLSNLSVFAYGQGMSQWAYNAPIGHLMSDLASPAYWSDAANILHEGDWIFAVHTVPGRGTYNVIYAVTSSPSGLWAQSLIASAPPIGVNPR